MPDPLLAAIEYAGYISIVKLVVFLVFFFLWIPLVTWVNNDAKAVETNDAFWTGLVLGSGAIAMLIWQFVPFFIIGLLVYVIAVAATSLAYVKHRNVRVMDFDRVLTAEHIKGLFSSKDEKMEALKSFTFITANRNEVPLPEPRTPDFFGYRMTYDLITDATWRRASDILFSPTPQEYRVVYYVDGAPIKQPSIPKEQANYIIHFLKQIADLDIKEKRKPQKGDFGVSKGGAYNDWQVTTAGSTAGEQIMIRHDIGEEIVKLEQLGLMPDQLQQISAFRQLKQGLFIAAGPKKSGVTTTFYTLLRNHDAFLNSINTLEKEPSEEVLNITQNIYSPSDTGTTTYGKKLEEIVRMGPDIVGVADCEDSETAKQACKAAKDGKIIYVQLEAPSVIQALAKWLKLVGDRRLVAETLIGISNQRLFRKLCAECRQAYAPNKDVFRKFNINAEKTKALYRAGKVIYDKHGKPSDCEQCQGTGYVGRTGVFETIIINEELRTVVREAKSLPEIGTRFRRAKMLYIQEQTLRKVIAGITSINEMIRVISPPAKKQKPKQQ
ncbi:MAG: Flp pilus assembly complex ATPase component TadA [Sedimentisphaerales bacterium]|nr:Flp pilus assembly complex ATPase component TadA [Sedimentisphaerales bacterium]